MTPDRDNIRFNVLRNALYHTGRRRTLERWNRACSFLVVVLGTAAFGQFLADRGILGQYFALASAMIGALQLAYDFGGRASHHQLLQREYGGLLSDIETSLCDTAELRAEWYGRMIRITSDEPPTLRALDAKAYNDALDATHGMDSTERLVIPFHHRLVGGYLSFDGYNYLKVAEKTQGIAADSVQ